MAATITDTQGIIAIAAAAVAVLALVGCAVLMLSVRRLRRAQVLVLGEQGKQDLVAHAIHASRTRLKRCGRMSTTSPCG